MTPDADEAARERVRDWARRAASAVGPDGSLRGASTGDVAEVAAVYAVDRLPAAVEEFLLLAGAPLSDANRIFNPEMLGVDVMRTGREAAALTAGGSGVDRSVWDRAVVVADSSNETVMWVYPDGPDPAVHYLDAGGGTGVGWERFTDYLDWALDSYVAAAN